MSSTTTAVNESNSSDIYLQHYQQGGILIRDVTSDDEEKFGSPSAGDKEEVVAPHQKERSDITAIVIKHQVPQQQSRFTRKTKRSNKMKLIIPDVVVVV